MAESLRFPKKFIFGVATSAYQIEGAAFEDGRIPSHWDTFAHAPGNTLEGETGDTACNHYHCYPEDVAAIARLGVSSYRFSFAWPRILTEDRQVNQKGLDFYHRLLDELEKQGVTPAATIYHWDLPQWLADRGGWANRDTVGYFMDFAEVLFSAYGDRIPRWITHNEPWCASFLSYGLGVHAPGHRDWRAAVMASHHILLSHGEVVKGYREMGLTGSIGITLNLNVVDAKTGEERDQAAVTRADGFQNRWFLDPVFKARYPADMMEIFRPYVQDYGFIHPGDLERIAQPMDFLGVNYYNRAVVYDDPDERLLEVGNVAAPASQSTTMGWEVHPDSLYRLIMRLNQDYTHLPIYITENGAAYADEVSADGHVHDVDRIKFIEGHLQAALRSIRDGSTLQGYYLWSLMDNFEWAEGYSQRFGIIYVDFATQQRIWKDSALWYRDLAQSQRG